MPFDLPDLGATTTNKDNIGTKIPEGLKALRDGSAITYAAGGTADAITLTTPAFPHTSYTEGLAHVIVPSATNTGAVTCALDGLAVKPVSKIKAGALVALVAGDMVNNLPILIRYNVSAGAYILEGLRQIVRADLPAILKADLPATVVHTDQANTFAQNQKIQAIAAELELDAPSGDTWIQFSQNGTKYGLIHGNFAQDEISIYDNGFGDTASWNIGTGKQTRGIVPLNRVGMSGSYTTLLLPAAQIDFRSITHGLGTDNVKVLCFGTGSIIAREWALMVRRPAGEVTVFGGRSADNASPPNLPASGTLGFVVRNTNSSSQTITIHYTILRED